MNRSQIFKRAHQNARYILRNDQYSRFKSYSEAFAAGLKQAWFTEKKLSNVDHEQECERFYNRHASTLQRVRLTD